MNNKKLFLLIDGDYFCHRTLHGIRMTDKEFNLVNSDEKEQYINTLKNSLMYLLERFKINIYNVGIVFDNTSWRKSVESFRPYYLKNNMEINVGYKANRKELKEKSDIDYDSFYECVENFSDYISDKMSVFKNLGFEGDDWLMLLSKKVSEISKDYYTCIFCTDGDLEQIVTNQTFIYKNSKSKEAPNGKILISNGIFESMFGTNNMSQKLTDINNKFEIFEKISTLNIDYNQPLIRKPNVDIIPASPLKLLLTKVICGDSKDNVFPLFRWKSSTGTRNFSVTEKMIEKVFKKYGFDYTEKGIFDLLQNNENLTNLIIGLADETKQFDIVKPIFKEIGNHFKHNLRILTLSDKQLPDHLISIFETIWLSNQQSFIGTKFDFETLSNKMDNRPSTGMDINKISIPEII